MKNKIYKFGLVLSLLLVVGCGSAVNEADQNQEDPETITPGVEVLLEQNNNRDDTETMEEDVSFAQMEADQVFLRKARTDLDLELCNKINSDKLKQDCVDVTNYQLVVASQSEDCGEIKNQDLATLCNQKLEEFQQRQSDAELFAQAANDKDPAVCDKIKEPADKDDCLMQLAFSEKDPQICERFEDAVTKQDCIDQL